MSQFDGTTAASLSHRYLYGPALDQILADEQLPFLVPGATRTGTDWGGSILWPLTDHLGSVRDIASDDFATNETTIVKPPPLRLLRQCSSPKPITPLWAIDACKMWADD